MKTLDQKKPKKGRPSLYTKVLAAGWGPRSDDQWQARAIEELARMMGFC